MRYAPIDWLYSRPHGRLIGRNDDLRMLSDINPFVMDDLADNISTALMLWGAHQEGLRLYGDVYKDDEREPMFWETAMCTAMPRFSKAGRNVFTFDAAMSQNLADIALDEVISDDLLLPYESFYLKFEDQMEPLPDGTPVDGVLVWSFLGAIEGENSGENIAALWHKLSDRLTARGMPITERNIHAEYCRHREEDPNRPKYLSVMLMPKPQEGQWTTRREVGRHWQVELKPGLPLIDAFDTQHTPRPSPKQGDNWLEHQLPLPCLRERLKLIFNAILYISRYAGDRPSRYHQGPAELVEKANAGKRPAQRELGRLGYTTTRLIGYGNLDDYSDAVGEEGSAGRAPHWRRAHWRNQPHGPQRSLRKLLLIRESRVGCSNGGEPEHTARVYKNPQVRTEPVEPEPV